MNTLVSRAADGLGLAATPVFATMAVLTQIGGASSPLCTPGPPGPHLDGMALMYLLMSVFHLGPWLRRAKGSPP